MKNLLLLTLVTFFAASSFAKSTSDNQSWNSLKFKTKFKSFNFTLHTEARYSEKTEGFFEEHLKPYVGYKTDFGEFGFVFSYLADDDFTTELEKRYAFQYGNTVLKNYHIDYSIRYRYELRKFKPQSEIAQRTRLRNQVKFKSLAFYRWMPFVSSELNYYINDTGMGPGGFSSHRGIAGVSRKFKDFKLSVSYINNYKVKNNNSDTRHALGLGLAFKI